MKPKKGGRINVVVVSPCLVVSVYRGIGTAELVPPPKMVSAMVKLKSVRLACRIG